MSNTTVSLAKTTRPTLSMVLNRERLFKKLDKGFEKKAVWIFGPPGSGKTTLVASYLESKSQISLWYQLDSNDADVASFFFYLRQTVLKHSGISEHLIPEIPADVENWASYGHQLFRAIFSSMEQPLLIVFDNYESLPAYSEIHEIFRQVIDDVTESSLLVCISRSSPAPNLARMIANDQLFLIDADDLKLTNEECFQIAKLRKAEVSKDALEKIIQTTAGWITGSIIMLEYTKQSRQLDKRQFGTPGNVLYDYIANEIFSGFDSITKDTLLKICWPNRLSAGMAEEISGEESTSELLSRLARNNYFVTGRDNTHGREFIIHPILREFLQAKSLELFKDEALNKIQHKTAELLLKAGQAEEAVELLAGNLDWETLEPVITQHAPLLVEQGRTTLLSSWLEELPQERLNRNPWLLFWYGKARQKQAPREARHHFELAFRKFKSGPENDVAGMILCCCGVIEAVLAEFDDFSLLDYWIDELLALNGNDADIQFHSYTRPVNVVTLMALMVRKPDHEDIDNWFSRTEISVRKNTYSLDGTRELTGMVLVYLLSGELEKAREYLEMLQQHLTQIDSPSLKCQIRLLDGLHKILTGDGDSAYEAAVDCLAMAEESASTYLLPMVYACGCCAALVQDNLDESRVWIDKLALLTAANNRLVRFLYHYILSWYALINDEIIEAHHEQRRALGYAVELGMPYFEVLSRTALGHLLFMCDDSRGVNAQLRKVHSIARDIKNPLLEFMTLLVYGDIAVSQGRTSTGINALQYALRLGREHAYYHLPWWQAGQLSNVCVTALQNNIETDYVKDFISRRGLPPVEASIDISEWPWPYRVRVFGELDIGIYEGNQFENLRSHGRPLQLLKVLIAMGGKDVNAGTAAKTLWPHVDADYGIKSLTINLHRLRRMFANDDTIFLRDGRLSVNPDLVWLDTWALENHIGNIESAVTIPGKVMNETGISRLFDRLVEIYQGPFLNDSDQLSCLVTARDHYRSEFVKGINLLVEKTGEDKISMNIPELYEQGIEKDPFAEALYRRLMLWYLNIDRQADAMDTYERCRIAMAGTPLRVPSAETQSIYNKLVKAAS